MKKKLFVTLIITLTTLLCTFACVNAEENINVILNDETVTFDTAPVMENDRILVPIRTIAEKMEFDVNWDQDTETVTLENDYNILKLKINDYQIKRTLKLMPQIIFEICTKEEAQELLDRYITYIDVSAKIINDRTYLPLRAITEAFGCEVNWNENSQTVEIFYAHTYGEEVNFKDEGIAILTKLKILEKEFDPHFDAEKQDTTPYYILNEEKLFQKLKALKVHEGDLKGITFLGEEFIDTSAIKVYTIEDIKKFPNLRSMRMSFANVQDLTPISCIKEWDTLYLDNCPFNIDITPLTKINVTTDFSIMGRDDTISCYMPNDSFDFSDFAKTLCKLYSKLQSIISETVDESMTTTEKIIALNNWICENVEYDKNYDCFNSKKFYLKNSQYSKEKSQLESAVLHGYAVCQGYAETLNTLCKMANIPCTIVRGTAYGIDPYGIKGWGGHAWNLVQLEDDKFYHVDTTWNDGTNNKYLLLTDEELEEFQDHTWDKDETNEYLNEYLLYLENHK